MNIQNSPRKLLHKPWRKQPHVSRETNQLNSMLLKRADNFAVMLLARQTFGRNHQRLQPALAGSRDPRRVGAIRNDYGNPCVRNSPRINTVGDSNEIRPTSGKQYAQGMHSETS